MATSDRIASLARTAFIGTYEWDRPAKRTLESIHMRYLAAAKEFGKDRSAVLHLASTTDDREQKQSLRNFAKTLQNAEREAYQVQYEARSLYDVRY